MSSTKASLVLNIWHALENFCPKDTIDALSFRHHYHRNPAKAPKMYVTALVVHYIS